MASAPSTAAASPVVAVAGPSVAAGVGTAASFPAAESAQDPRLHRQVHGGRKIDFLIFLLFLLFSFSHVMEELHDPTPKGDLLLRGGRFLSGRVPVSFPHFNHWT